jgi:cytochrome c
MDMLHKMTIPLAPFAMMFSLFAAAPVPAALAYPGCAALNDTDFTVTTLAKYGPDTLREPMKMAYDLVAQPGEDAKDRVDVYFTERAGKLRKYDARQRKVLTLGKLATVYSVATSDGLQGIALDPDFRTNHNLFLYYTYKDAGETSWRVSRFTLDVANQRLDLNSEVVVLKIPIIIGSKHPGGALKFDAQGDLWITTGNDYQEEPVKDEYPIWSSANTNDLRGKILRIHPTADGKYTVPAGNLFPAGTAKTRPEIYVMGARNPYSLTIDPVRHWIFWGDVGPDKLDMDGQTLPPNTEEHNLTTGPGNFGYPFFAGNNAPLKKGMNPKAPAIPAGTQWNGADPGLDVLPPAVPAVHAYIRSCAITGPLYRYDSALRSSIKMPPHLDGKWLWTDYNGESSPVTAVTVSDDGKALLAQDPVAPAKLKLIKPLVLDVGPDGALYVNNFAGTRTVLGSANTSLVRIEYRGACGVAGLGAPAAASGGAVRMDVLPGRALSLRVSAPGAFTVAAYDLRGNRLASRRGNGHSQVTLGEIERPGVYLVRLVTGDGVAATLKVMRP